MIMGLQPINPSAASASLDQLLSTLPSLPRPLLDRLVARMIDHLDEIDGDPDFEPDDFAEVEDGL